jgi:mRNA interferase HicA
MKRRDLERKMKNLGYWSLREGGNHTVWTNGKVNIPIPRHAEINERTAQGILKQARRGV